MSERRKKTRLTEEELREKERVMRSGGGVRQKGTGRVSEEFWKMPKPKDPEGLALRYLLEDRREGR
jgi:hypothetical protein